jgi:hypothetical protein
MDKEGKIKNLHQVRSNNSPDIKDCSSYDPKVEIRPALRVINIKTERNHRKL